MHDLDGNAYTELTTAFLFRSSYDPACTCRPRPWTVAAQRNHREMRRPPARRPSAKRRPRPRRSHRSLQEAGPRRPRPLAAAMAWGVPNRPRRAPRPPSRGRASGAPALPGAPRHRARGPRRPRASPSGGFGEPPIRRNRLAHHALPAILNRHRPSSRARLRRPAHLAFLISWILLLRNALNSFCR